ncbi:MAG: imidazolonepropionase [Pseudomonadota bacterium]
MSATSHPTLVLHNAHIATIAGDIGYGIVSNGYIAISDGTILEVGHSSELEDQAPEAQVIDLKGRLVTPGLIDCHTHLVYAGSRAQEFDMRLRGASYEDISRAGGGIISTVAATRHATESELVESALQRVDRLIAEGVTSIEIKSGYGLDLDTERKMLRTARRLGVERPIRVRTTFLGAHAVPDSSNADAYIDDVCIPTMIELAGEGLIDAVDGFCESIGFSPAQIERLFEKARTLGLPVKLHAEQLSALGGSFLAARFKALSADHLEYATDDDIRALKEAGTVATLLPGAFYFLKETKKPPVEALRRAGVPMAVATDSNPGSSPMTSILLAMNMAATLFDLTPEEALRGVTVNAAQALSLIHCGRIQSGFAADLAVWDTDDPAELTYRIGDASLFMRIFEGKPC